jgi:hypothetical protein
MVYVVGLDAGAMECRIAGDNGRALLGRTSCRVCHAVSEIHTDD